MAMKEHYGLQRSGQSKGLTGILSMFGVTLAALYFAGKLEPFYILMAFTVATSVYFVPGIFQSISAMILTMRMKFKQPS